MIFHRAIAAFALLRFGVHAFASRRSVVAAWHSRRSCRDVDLQSVLAAPALLHLDGRYSVCSFEQQYFSRLCDRTRLSAKSGKKTDRRASSSSGGGGGFGGGTTASASAKKSPPPSKDALAKRLKQVYGGTSPQDIAAGTQRRVERAFQGLPDHLKMATTLYQQVTLWDERLNQLSLLEQSQLPPGDVEGANRARIELESLCARHNVTQVQLHNVFQQITWDSSADAKAARAVASNGQMPADVAARIDRACSIIADAVMRVGDDDNNSNQGSKGRCLDVGCGYGVLVPHLVKAGVAAEQIVGIDLSPEMIRNAQEQHGSSSAVRSGKRGGGQQLGIPTFVARDFLNEYNDSDGFDGIIFCMSLHDMPDLVQALDKACQLLRPEGALVVVHPQGAAHVRKQHVQNPVLVRRCLPGAKELESLTQTSLLGMELVTAPAPDGSVQESNEGYLCVLKKKR